MRRPRFPFLFLFIVLFLSLLLLVECVKQDVQCAECGIFKSKDLKGRHFMKQEPRPIPEWLKDHSFPHKSLFLCRKCFSRLSAADYNMKKRVQKVSTKKIPQQIKKENDTAQCTPQQESGPEKTEVTEEKLLKRLKRALEEFSDELAPPSKRPRTEQEQPSILVIQETPETKSCRGFNAQLNENLTHLFAKYDAAPNTILSQIYHDEKVWRSSRCQRQFPPEKNKQMCEACSSDTDHLKVVLRTKNMEKSSFVQPKDLKRKLKENEKILKEKEKEIQDLEAECMKLLHENSELKIQSENWKELCQEYFQKYTEELEMKESHELIKLLTKVLSANKVNHKHLNYQIIKAQLE